MSTPNKTPKRSFGTYAIWLPVGIGLGTALGVALDNLGLWLAIGVAIGSAGGSLGQKKDNSD
jgi:hypothetical protein